LFSHSIEEISSFSFVLIFFLILQVIYNYFLKQGNGEDRLKCHQCMKKRTVVPCTKCKQKMYCIPCIKQWWGILYTFNFFFVKMSLYSKKPIFNHIILAEFCVYRYPRLKEEEISELCPFCRGNCNCNACLHSNGMIKVWLLSYWTVNAFKLLPLKKQPDFFLCVCVSF